MAINMGKGRPPQQGQGKTRERKRGELPPFWVQQGRDGAIYFQSGKITPDMREEIIACLNEGYDRVRVYIKDRQIEVTDLPGFDEKKPVMALFLVPPQGQGQGQGKFGGRAPAAPPAAAPDDECPF